MTNPLVEWGKCNLNVPSLLGEMNSLLHRVSPSEVKSGAALAEVQTLLAESRGEDSVLLMDETLLAPFAQRILEQAPAYLQSHWYGTEFIASLFLGLLVVWRLP